MIVRDEWLTFNSETIGNRFVIILCGAFLFKNIAWNLIQQFVLILVSGQSFARLTSVRLILQWPIHMQLYVQFSPLDVCKTFPKSLMILDETTVMSTVIARIFWISPV